MYKVVIVDDEPIIVRGLSRMLPWDRYGCEVAGAAYDGRDGLELIRSLRPHILITDIYMPQMDGLTMVAGLKSEFEDLEITVLTGYRDFEMAQKAICLGVARFLLKPSNMEELEEAVRAMTARLQKKGIMGEELLQENTGERTAQEQTGEETEGVRGDNAAGSFLVNRALEYMREHYAQKITLTDVAENTYVSQWHLSRLLNRHTGQSFSALLNSIRIEEARRLLKDPSLRVGDVAERVGFQEMAHFSRVFKKLTGMSANEYRNRNG